MLIHGRRRCRGRGADRERRGPFVSLEGVGQRWNRLSRRLGAPVAEGLLSAEPAARSRVQGQRSARRGGRPRWDDVSGDAAVAADARSAAVRRIARQDPLARDAGGAEEAAGLAWGAGAAPDAPAALAARADGGLARVAKAGLRPELRPRQAFL